MCAVAATYAEGMDVYADAAGLVERSAAAYSAGVPQRPADDGFFGPASMTWRASGDLSAPIGGLRALLIQALHPLAMAGVDQHSDWREDPIGRLAATSRYLATVSFGDKAAAERIAASVRRIHEKVTGTDTFTGKPYAASDPALLLWVHAALVDSTLVARTLFGTPLSAADADSYVAEMADRRRTDRGAALTRCRRPWPNSTAYLESVRPELACTPAAKESMAYLLDPPGLDEDIAEIWQDIRDGAVVSLPDWARELYGYEIEPLTEARQTEIRQALGVLDAVYLGEPGVLEARQRITAKVRAARA